MRAKFTHPGAPSLAEEVKASFHVAALSLAAAVAFTSAVQAQTRSTGPSGTIVVGVAAPLSGSAEALGRQIVAGARAAAAAHGETVDISQADTTCSGEGGAAAAEALSNERAQIVIGFLCAESIEAALPLLREAGIATLDVGVRANRLTDKRKRTGDLVWRVAPRSDAIASKIAATIADRWADAPFGLIDDGSIAERGLSDTVRRLLADRGLRPQTVDTYRPAEEKQFGIARRLQRTGVTRFFISGDRPDIATIMRDAADLGLSLSVIGGETLFDEAGEDVPLAEGVIAVGPRSSFPELSEAPASAQPEGLAGEERAFVEDAMAPQGYFGTAYAATEIAILAAREARAGDRKMPAILSNTRFETKLGPVTFDPNGDSNLDLFRVFRWTGERFVQEAGG